MFHACFPLFDCGTGDWFQSSLAEQYALFSPLRKQGRVAGSNPAKLKTAYIGVWRVCLKYLTEADRDLFAMTAEATIVEYGYFQTIRFVEHRGQDQLFGLGQVWVERYFQRLFFR